MKLSILAPVFLILLSSLLEFANSDPRWSRGRFRTGFRRLIDGIRFRRRYHGCRPVGCTVSKWSSWNHCSQSCGGSGIQTRNRHIVRTQKCGGHCNYALLEKRFCNRFCLNGGRLMYNRNCRCKYGYSGRCCERGRRDYSHRGCFTDSGSRAMPNKILKNLAQYYDAVKRCAKLSYSKKYKCFGVQNGRECWSGPNAHKTYNKYGHSQKCKNGKGGPYANDVYCYRGVPWAPVPMQAPNAGPKPTEAGKISKKNCWSDWAYSECTKPCGCGYKARTRYCKCGAGKYGSCKGLAMETFKCNCHQCGPPIDA